MYYFSQIKLFDKAHYEKCIRVTQLKKFVNKLFLKDKTIIGENGAEISGGGHKE